MCLRILLSADEFPLCDGLFMLRCKLASGIHCSNHCKAIICITKQYFLKCCAIRLSMSGWIQVHENGSRQGPLIP